MSIWDLERPSLSAIIRMMSSVATLKWRVLIGQCFIIGIVSSVGVLKMRASDLTVLWTMHHLFIPFYCTHSEGKVESVVLLGTLLLFFAITCSFIHHFNIMAQRYVDSTIDDKSLCWIWVSVRQHC